MNVHQMNGFYEEDVYNEDNENRGNIKTKNLQLIFIHLK